MLKVFVIWDYKFRTGRFGLNIIIFVYLIRFCSYKIRIKGRYNRFYISFGLLRYELFIMPSDKTKKTKQKKPKPYHLCFRGFFTPDLADWFQIILLIYLIFSFCCISVYASLAMWWLTDLLSISIDTPYFELNQSLWDNCNATTLFTS